MIFNKYIIHIINTENIGWNPDKKMTQNLYIYLHMSMDIVLLDKKNCKTKESRGDLAPTLPQEMSPQQRKLQFHPDDVIVSNIYVTRQPK